MKKHIFLIALLVFGGYFLTGIESVHAADFRIGLFPPIFQIDATTPVAIKKDITVVNAGDETITLTVSFKMFQQGPYSNGQVAYISDKDISPDKDIFQKMQLLDEDTIVTSITLGPRQKKTYTIHIGLPKDEPPADYYFSILFSSQNAQNTTQNASAINASIAANILLSIGPKDKTEGLLEEFSAPWFLQTGPVPFTVLLTNLSRHFINPTGHIYIRNMFGQLIGRVDLLPVNVLGQSSRYIPSQDSPSSNLRPTATWNEKVLFGPYRANIVISLSSDGPILTKTIYFFAMPIQYIVGFFVAIGISTFIVSRVRRNMQHI